ncbi:hypothetical protein Deba_3030 [Desulfarculus baarsii DSM 2075]|uniref:Uncharacterized protein n=1 Tax=Desulfarculus baarsii (strain ATCC 33931 / DSM 2075 / LMG 7858 / VKM B-1802 / 2st14) TaxID=644282 RepID=E1QLE8_DESB2|nr:hypothetical protein [Desulfarculus baarsii]ADK86383.1 hypothetical protein Deba_3030 [Desulfarculus baarsii DSM 2075]
MSQTLILVMAAAGAALGAAALILAVLALRRAAKAAAPSAESPCAALAERLDLAESQACALGGWMAQTDQRVQALEKASGAAVERQRGEASAVGAPSPEGHDDVVDELLSAYNASLEKPGYPQAEDLADRFALADYRLRNYDARRVNPDVAPEWSRPGPGQEVHYYALRWAGEEFLVPSFDAYASQSLLLADGGWGGDAWLQGIFERANGPRFRVLRAARLRGKLVVEQGLLALPLAQDRP